MDKEVQQLVEMGATVPQARAALRVYKDVMEAAEKIFEGKFDNVTDEDGDVQMGSSTKVPGGASDEEEYGDELDDGDEDDPFVDYDSDDAMGQSAPPKVDVDPYAGIFFSKDRREEVIEIEEDPEEAVVEGPNGPTKVTLMTQGQWMKGCPEGSEQSFLFQLYNELSQEPCRCPQECGGSIPRRKSDFFAIFPEFSQYTAHLRSNVRKTCPKCRAVDFCFACGESVSQAKRTTPNDQLFHCPNLQGVILGIGLSMLEQMFTEQGQDKGGSTPGEPQPKRRKTTPSPADDDDVHYSYGPRGQSAARGTGYAGVAREDMSGQLAAAAAQLERDTTMGNLLRQVRIYLPNLHREGGGLASDYLVHPTALAHLRRRFNKVSSALLRNDSLADMSERGPPLYFELLEWLETISKHEALASMMAMPIMIVGSVKAVKGNGHARERLIVYEGSAGPRELLEHIAIQAKAALKGLEGPKAQEAEEQELTEEQKRMAVDQANAKQKEAAVAPPDEKQKLLSFCRRILSTASTIDQYLRDNKGDAFVERLYASLPKIMTSGSVHFNVSVGTSAEMTQKNYVDWANRVKFEYCDLTLPAGEQPTVSDGDAPHYRFHFNYEARILASSDIPKRSLAIAKELAILTTNLPVAWDSSVFLRVDETRVDIIKALITGPEGTPYYNGCYLFDIFLGPNYNQSPPSVKYMTTGGGKYRFNPNLYAVCMSLSGIPPYLSPPIWQDGKVCLSLLGTWQGPGWVAGKSTLLQVLISIQSMILVPDPYINEPGWSSSGGTPAALAYSANVRRMVVKIAMLENLKNPPEPFADVIRTHFKLKAESLMKQLDEWVEQDDKRDVNAQGGMGDGGPVGKGASFQKDVRELKKLLSEL